MKHGKTTILSFVLFISGIGAFAQQASPAWAVTNLFSNNVFIENKGQFKTPNQSDAAVLFAIDNSGTKIYFTQKGLVYSFTKKTVNGQNENGNTVESEEQEEKEGKVKVESDVVTMNWVGANKNAELVSEDGVSDYYSYSLRNQDGSLKNINNVKAYKKLVYKNLYPGIDVEYIFHEGTGIEYSLILHEGADISVVKMMYSDGHQVSIINGNVNIHTSVGDIMDHAPSTYYSADGGKIVSSFELNGNTISFKLADYDNSKSITIDPWTITPSFPNSNKIWNVQTDGSGNVYLYGGDSPLTLKQFTSTGTLVWTYNTPWDSANYWLGTLITDRTGNSYITAGANGEISKINNAGGLVWHNNPNSAPFPTYEYWHEALNCDQTQLVVSGTELPSLSTSSFRGMVMNINMTNGSIANKTTIGWIAGFNIKEGRSICSSPNGNFYFLTLDSIGCLTPSLSMTYKNPNSYNFPYGSPTYAAVGNLGLNAMKATANFIYTQNGAHVDKRNIGSGAIVATAAIPGGSASSNSPNNNGIDIDSCGNVYVGSGNAVVEYNSNLTQIASVATPHAVYDVAVNNNGEVVACGDGFAMSINFSACKPSAPICKLCTNPTVTKTITNPLCYGATGSAKVTATGGGPFYYSWSGLTDTTSSSNSLAPGSYTVTVTNAGGCSTFDTVVITQPAQMTIAVTTAPSCSGSNGTATAVVKGGTGPYTYSWAPSGGSNVTATGLAAGTYTCTITDKNGCSQTQTGTVSSASGSGPTVTMTSTSATCGSCNGTATATPTGSGPFGYLWSNADTTQVINNLCAGTYTVTVTPSSGSTTNAVFYSENFSTGGTGWTLNVKGSTPNGKHQNLWKIDNSSPLCSSGGNYLHVGCSSSDASFTCNPGATYDPGNPIFDKSRTDKYAYSPVISTVGKTNMTLTFIYQCNGGGSPVTDYGKVALYNGTTWTDLPTAYSGITSCTKASISIPAAYNGLTNFQFGFRWVNSDSGNGADPPFAIDSISISATSSVVGCPTVETVTVPSGAGSFTLTTTPTNASCGKNNGSASVTPSIGGTFTYKWSNGQTSQTATNLSAGTYTVVASTSGGCADSTVVTIGNSGGPTVTPTAVDPKCNGSTGLAVANPTGGTGPYTYNWTPSGGTKDTATGLAAGSYTCAVTDKNGCLTIDSVKITQPTAIAANVTGTTPANCGSANGSATVAASGGTGALTYSWSPSGGTSATASNIAAGTYTCTVTDANGCSKAVIAAVSNTGGPSVTTTSTSPKCNGGTGVAVANVTGGTGPYTYNWSPSGGTKDTANNLSAGTYTCTVTDKNGCITNDTVKITQPAAIPGSTSVTNASCGASDGGATVTAGGGTGVFSYSWSPSGGTTATASNLAAGTYTCTVMDANGCTKQIVALISNIGAPSVTSSENSEQCFGDNNGSATVVASGGTAPYTYNWSPSGGTNATANNLTAGTYTCVITDSKGCITDDTVHVSQPAALASTVIANPASCGKPGSATVTPVGGTGPYTYSWSPSGGTNVTASLLVAGTYTCTVTDANGCKQILNATITGNSGPAVTISSDTLIKYGSSVTIFATGGGTYQWSPATGLTCPTCANTIANPSRNTTYCVLVTDSSGCADSACMTIDVELPCGDIYVPNAFSPNGDHENDLECVYGNCIETIDFSIYDRWGNKVFGTTDPSNTCWDGRYKGELMNSAVFVYTLEYTLTNGDKLSKKGNITLVR